MWSSALLPCCFWETSPLSQSLPRSSHPAPTPLPIISPVHYSSSCAAGALCLTSPLLTQPLLTGTVVGLCGRSEEPHWTTDVMLITYISQCDMPMLRRFPPLPGLFLWALSPQIKMKGPVVAFGRVTSSFIISYCEHDWWHSSQRWSLPNHLVSYVQYMKTIKEQACGEMTAVYENYFFFPVFVIVTQHAPAHHF